MFSRGSAGSGRAPCAPLQWSGVFPSTEQLLVQGGDSRIALDPHSGMNRYGCPPFPASGMAAFGSTTASVISAPAFHAADSLRDRIALASRDARPGIYVREMERMRLELAQLAGISGLPGAEIVFAASGTDIHLIAACLTRASQPLPLSIIMIDAAETGAGVPAALTCRHFSARSACGSLVTEGGPVGPDKSLNVTNIGIRRADGSPLPAEIVDAAFERSARQAAARGDRVLVILNDLGKTGMLAPSPACVAALRTAMPESVDVLVDACQFRISESTVRAYLEQGFMVALTGSKFLGGPSFSGALLVPRSAVERFRNQPLGSMLSAYSARAEWPSRWDGAQSMEQAANPGLMLRWEAALAELRAFRAVSDAEIQTFLRSFAAAVTARLEDDPLFQAVAVPEIDRRPLAGVDGWDSIPTIFSFLLHRMDSRAGFRFLDLRETQAVYHLLRTDLTGQAGLYLSHVEEKCAGLRCQLGQPVVCGSEAATPLSALRLSIGARQIVAATQEGKAREIIDEAMAVLDKTAWLVRSRLFHDSPPDGECALARSAADGSGPIRNAAAGATVHPAFGRR
ncbi:MAG: hypothetical protein ACYDGU_01745 [Acidiferrobacterales bacterium]